MLELAGPAGVCRWPASACLQAARAELASIFIEHTRSLPGHAGSLPAACLDLLVACLVSPGMSWRPLAALSGSWRLVTAPRNSWRLLAAPGGASRCLVAPVDGTWRFCNLEHCPKCQPLSRHIQMHIILLKHARNAVHLHTCLVQTYLTLFHTFQT